MDRDPTTVPSPGSRTTLPATALLGVGAALLAAALTTCGAPDTAELDVVAGRMVVLPFETSEGTQDPVAAAALEVIAEVAAQVEGADIVRVDSDAAGDGTARSVAVETGASMVLRGSVRSVGQDMVLSAEVLDPTDPSRRHALPAERGPASDPSGAVARLAGRVAGALALHLDDEWTAPWHHSVPTLEAYRVNKRGDSLFAQNSQEEALPFFYEAHALDTAYLNPLFAATAVNNNMGRRTVGDSLLTYIEARADRLTELERFSIQWYRGNPEEALEAARGAAAIDPMGWTYGVGYRANRAGHFAEAVEWLGRRQELAEEGSYWARTWPAFRGQYMMALHAVGDHATELAEAQLARSELADNPWWIWPEIRARAAMGQADVVRAQLDTVDALLETSPNPSHWENLEDVAMELKVHGHPELGQELQERVVAHYRAQENILQLGDALGFAGRPREAYEVLTPLAGEGANFNVLGWYGVAAAVTGDAEAAREALARLEGLTDIAFGGSLRYQAAIHGALGACDRAIALYEQATEAGFSYTQAWGGEWWHRDWDTEPVQANCPGFQALLEKG